MNNNQHMGTIRIICKPYVHILYRILYCTMPWLWRYKFYVYVDDNEYLIHSKQKQVDIHVVPGEHSIYISQMKKKIGDIADVAGDILKIGGLATRNANTFIAGHAMKELKINENDYHRGVIQAGEIVEIKLKRNIIHVLVRDE